jgi:hypothetical protein
MSMNFAREQSLLRQRLQGKGSPARAAERQQQHGTTLQFLGAEDGEIQAAARDLAAVYPQMGRAQMTAFVRTLWNSKIHELRAVGVQLLAQRAALLEPHDLPLLEGFLRDDAADSVLHQLAHDVLGALLLRHKKVWKELKRYATGEHPGLRRAALRAAAPSLRTEADAFARFRDLAEPLLAHVDPLVQRAIDDALLAAAAADHAQAAAFVQQHARTVQLPAPAIAPVQAPAAEPPPPTPATPKAKSPAGGVAEAAATATHGRGTASAAKPAANTPAANTPAAKAAKSRPKLVASKPKPAKKPAAKLVPAKVGKPKSGGKKPTAAARTSKPRGKTR